MRSMSNDGDLSDRNSLSSDGYQSNTQVALTYWHTNSNVPLTEISFVLDFDLSKLHMHIPV